MSEDYDINPLPNSQQGKPEAIKQQLLQIWALAQKDSEPWLRAEASAAGQDRLEDSRYALGQMPPRQFVKKFQQQNPLVNLKALHTYRPEEIASALLSLLNPDEQDEIETSRAAVEQRMVQILSGIERRLAECREHQEWADHDRQSIEDKADWLLCDLKWLVNPLEVQNLQAALHAVKQAKGEVSG